MRFQLYEAQPYLPCKGLMKNLERRLYILKLMEAVDEYISDPVRQLDKPFLMPIEDVFSIQGRETVVTGRVEHGTIKVGEEVEVLGLTQGEPLKTTVIGVEMFKKMLDRGQAGDNVGLLLRGLKRDDVQREMDKDLH